MPDAAEKRLEWLPSALRAYKETLAHIAYDDPATASVVDERVEHTLALIARYPGLGTPGSRRGERRFAIPNTGHVVNYRVTRRAILILLWYRARQRVQR